MPLTASDVRSERIDVFAQYSLMRLSKNPATSEDAHGMVAAVKTGELDGIYKEDEAAPAKRARRWDTWWWKIIPKGEDGVLVLHPDDPLNGPPIIVFRDSVRSNKPRIDAALVRAWRAFGTMRDPGFRVEPCPGADVPTAMAGAMSVGAFVPLNTYPAFCADVLPAAATLRVEFAAKRSGGGKAPVCDFKLESTEKDEHDEPTWTLPAKGKSKRGTSATFDVPLGRFRLVVKPREARLWELSAEFEATPLGVGAVPLEKNEDVYHFRILPLNPGSPPSGTIEAFVSQLRISTARAAQVAGLPSWQTPKSDKLNFIHPTVVRSHKLQLDPPEWAEREWVLSQPKGKKGDRKWVREWVGLHVSPRTDDQVLELRGVKAPKLIAVSWPQNVPRASPAPIPFLLPRTPFLVFYQYPIAESLQPDEYGPYPWHEPYLRHGFVKYLRFRQHPLLQWISDKGLPYQIHRSRANVVLVLPLPHIKLSTGFGFGIFQQPREVHRMLRDIQAFMLRRESLFTPPTDIGRVALAGWSEGNTYVQQLLASGDREFVDGRVQEVYGIDPIGRGGGGVVPWINTAKRWADRGKGKMVRLYMFADLENAFLPTKYGELIGKKRITGTPPLIEDSDDHLRSVFVATHPDWQSAANAAFATAPANKQPPQPPEGLTAHQSNMAFMVTDALRRSVARAGFGTRAWRRPP